MKQESKLSPTMEWAMRVAVASNGKLTRFPGGFWRAHATATRAFGTSTVNALVGRGELRYTKWQDRNNGGPKFPIEASLVPKDPTPNSAPDAAIYEEVGYPEKS
jgi:hypothetical protein